MGKRKFLVLEDEEFIQEYLTWVLRELGYQVLTASSIESAQNIVKNDEGQDITDFLIDLNLPDGSGFNFISWLGERVSLSEDSDHGVVVISGNVEMIDMNLAHSLGVRNILEKPFSQDLLREMLEI